MSDLIAFTKDTEISEDVSAEVKGFIHMVKESQSNVQIHMYTEMRLRLPSSQKSNSIFYLEAKGGLSFPVKKLTKAFLSYIS